MEIFIAIAIIAIGIIVIIVKNNEDYVPSSKTVKYEKPKPKPIFSEKVKIDRKESNAKRIFDPCTIAFEVKGTNFRTDSEIQAARFLEKGDTLILVPEPDNAVDPNAVKVYNINGVHIGYVQKNLSAFVFERIDHVESCKVKKVSKHDIPFIDVELKISASQKAQPDFIPKEYQITAEDQMLSLGTPRYSEIKNSAYGYAIRTVKGTYELSNQSITRAKALVQGERIVLKKIEPTKYFPNRIDIYTKDNICVGYISDRLGSDLYTHFEEIKEVFVDMPMSESDYNHFAIRIIIPETIEKECTPFGITTSIISEYDGPYPELAEADSIKRTDTEKALQLILPIAHKERGIEAKFMCCQCYRLLKDYESEERMIQKIIHTIETIDKNFVSPNMYWSLKRSLPIMQKRLNTVQTRLANRRNNNK